MPYNGYSMKSYTPQFYARVLWVLFAAFCFRVVGQMLVAADMAPFLPPMQEWFSGVVPYPWLVVSQLLIICLLIKICLDFTRGQGFFVRSNPRMASFLTIFGGLYLGIMIARYVIRMSLYPAEHWTGGSIPIFFHWVLAGFLLTVAHYQRRNIPPRLPESPGLTTKKVFKRTAWTVTGLLILAWVALQTAPGWMGWKLDTRPSHYAVRSTSNVSMTTSDGIALLSEIYRPRRIDKTPTLLVRAPLPENHRVRMFIDLVGRFWASRGYTVVFQRTRGTPPSGGEFYPLRFERRDGIDTLAWISKQPWYNGKVGMWGGSTFGYTQWAVADQQNPGPSALLIYESSTDFYKMFYPSGTFSLASALFWAVRSERGAFPAVSELNKGFETGALREADDRALRDIPYFNDWVDHPQRDSYWKAIDVGENISNLKSPVLFMAGWFDPFLPAQLEDYRRVLQEADRTISKKSRLILGPWSHAMTVRMADGTIDADFRSATLLPSIDWFDRHLMPGRQEPRTDPPVRIFVMGDNTWRNEKEWPLARTHYEDFYLNGRGELTSVLPGKKASTLGFTHDPSNPVPSLGGATIGFTNEVPSQDPLDGRDDILRYSGAALAVDTEVTGPVSMDLYVSTTQGPRDIFARLVDVFPSGSSFFVTDGMARVSSTENSPTRINFWPTSYVFKKGHRLELILSASSYPRYALNSSTGKVRFTIRHGGGPGMASKLTLPVIPLE